MKNIYYVFLNGDLESKVIATEEMFNTWYDGLSTGLDYLGSCEQEVYILNADGKIENKDWTDEPEAKTIKKINGFTGAPLEL